MNKQHNDRPCRIRKRVPTGWLEAVSFLPEPYANPGATLRIKDRSGNGDEGGEARERRTGEGLWRNDSEA